MAAWRTSPPTRSQANDSASRVSAGRSGSSTRRRPTATASPSHRRRRQPAGPAFGAPSGLSSLPLSARWRSPSPVAGSTITAGLLVIAVVIGWLVAALVSFGADPGAGRTGRRATATVIALAGVALGQIGLWLIARQEGGTLGVIDYLAEVFGFLVPLELALAGAARLVANDDDRVDRAAVPAAHRRRSCPDRRPGRRMVGWPPDASAPASAVVPALHRHVVDRRGASRVGWPASSWRSSARTTRRRATSTWSRPTRTGGAAASGVRCTSRCSGTCVARGVRRVRAITWPGNRQSVSFHRSMGFRVDDGPGTQNLYGTPAYADYDGEGDDRVVFTRDL